MALITGEDLDDIRNAAENVLSAIRHYRAVVSDLRGQTLSSTPARAMVDATAGGCDENILREWETSD